MSYCTRYGVHLPKPTVRDAYALLEMSPELPPDVHLTEYQGDRNNRISPLLLQGVVFSAVFERYILKHLVLRRFLPAMSSMGIRCSRSVNFSHACRENGVGT